jgi:hypothetical protein
METKKTHRIVRIDGVVDGYKTYTFRVKDLNSFVLDNSPKQILKECCNMYAAVTGSNNMELIIEKAEILSVSSYCTYFDSDYGITFNVPTSTENHFYMFKVTKHRLKN